MRSIAVRLHPRGRSVRYHERNARLARRSSMRTLQRFTCDRSPGWSVICVDFEKDFEAEAFKKQFGGAEDRITSQTMAKACWWRLMAEELRTEADGFSSASAKDTMLFAARTLEQMAKDVERRLETRETSGSVRISQPPTAAHSRK
jgi:hypothetical protein